MLTDIDTHVGSCVRVTEMGTDHEIFTCDVPLPVSAGDGSVTRSHQGDMSVFSTHYQRNGQLRGIPKGYG